MSLPEYKTILYATDLGDHMRPVFRHAISLAKHYKAKIIMFHAVEPLGPTGQWFLETYLPKKSDALDDESGLKKVLKQMKKRLEKFYTDELADEKSKFVSDIVVVSGRPGEEINNYAVKKDVDLIVLGTHTTGGWEHGLLGSTARHLTHITRKPVLVIPVGEE